MTSISNIDTSFYPGLIEGFAPKSTQPIKALQPEAQEPGIEYLSAQSYSDFEEVDLSNYYNDVNPEDLLTQAGKNLTESANKFKDAVASALQNGYGVNDICNLKMAEMAYKASAKVFNVASEVSTFTLKV